MDIAYLLNSRVPSDNAHVIQVLQMCEGLLECGHDVTVFYPDRKQTNPELRQTSITDYYEISDDLTFKSLPYLDINSFYTRLQEGGVSQASLSRALFSLQAALRTHRESFDLYYTRGWFIATLLVTFGSPTILEIHKQALGKWGQQALGRIGQSRNLKGVVTLTEPAHDALVQAGIPPEKIYVEPDAVSLDAYDPPLSKATARERIGLPETETYVGYTGSLTKGKGVRTLVEACADLPVSVLVVGGREDERDALADHLDDSDIGNARLAGQVDPTAVPVYQQAADILALPPRADVENHRHHPQTTSPLKLFEYMAARRPIVATRLPGIEDVLTHGKNSLLVQPGEPTAMRDAIARLLDEETVGKTLATQAAKDVEAYTWKRRSERILDAVK